MVLTSVLTSFRQPYHSPPARNATPTGLFGRKTGQAPGFSYTDANKNKGAFLALLPSFISTLALFPSLIFSFPFPVLPLSCAGITWGEDTLDVYLTNPKFVAQCRLSSSKIHRSLCCASYSPPALPTPR